MPKIFSINGYNIYFWTNEGNPPEPIHVHISKKPHENATKVWIKSDGTCEVDDNKDKIPKHTLNDIVEVIEYSSEIIIKDWEQVFGEVTFRDEIKNKEISR